MNSINCRIRLQVLYLSYYPRHGGKIRILKESHMTLEQCIRFELWLFQQLRPKLQTFVATWHRNACNICSISLSRISFHYIQCVRWQQRLRDEPCDSCSYLFIDAFDAIDIVGIGDAPYFFSLCIIPLSQYLHCICRRESTAGRGALLVRIAITILLVVKKTIFIMASNNQKFTRFNHQLPKGFFVMIASCNGLNSLTWRNCIEIILSFLVWNK